MWQWSVSQYILWQRSSSQNILWQWSVSHYILWQGSSSQYILWQRSVSQYILWQRSVSQYIVTIFQLCKWILTLSVSAFQLLVTAWGRRITERETNDFQWQYIRYFFLSNYYFNVLSHLTCKNHAFVKWSTNESCFLMLGSI